MSEKAEERPPRVLVPDLAEFLARLEEHQKISLKVEEREHVRSRRLRDGDEVVALDGKGSRAAAVLVSGGSAIALLPSKKISSLLLHGKGEARQEKLSWWRIGR